jgi:hypothetical protein
MDDRSPSGADSGSNFFTSRPPSQDQRQTFPVARSSPKKWGLTLRVLMLSDRVTCAPTHHKGRTIPCLEPWARKCEACDQGWKPRWLGYIAAFHPIRHIKCLLELTATAAETLGAAAEQKGSLRGHWITVSRVGDRPNGPLMVQWAPSDFTDEQVPESFSVQQALLRLWNVHQHVANADPLGRQLAAETVTAEDPRIAGDLAADAFKHRHNGRKEVTTP